MNNVIDSIRPVKPICKIFCYKFWTGTIVVRNEEFPKRICCAASKVFFVFKLYSIVIFSEVSPACN